MCTKNGLLVDVFDRMETKDVGVDVRMLDPIFPSSLLEIFEPFFTVFTSPCVCVQVASCLLPLDNLVNHPTVNTNF